MSVLPLLAGSRRGRSGEAPPPPPPAGIAITVSPGSRTTPVDSVVTYTITLARENHPGDVALTIEGLSALVGGSFSPATLTGDTLQSTLSVTVGASAVPVVADPFTVRAASAGVDDATATAELTIVEAGIGTAMLTATPLWGVLEPESSIDFTIGAVRDNFTADIPVAVADLPAGVTATFPDGATISGDGTVTCRLTAGAAPANVYGHGWQVTCAAPEVASREAYISTPPAGAYAYMAPRARLPRDANGVPMGYDSATGLCTGTPFDTSWLTRAWAIANADTVVTVKAAGGDYGETQLQDAIDDAAVRNDLTFIVIDKQLITKRFPANSTAGMRLRSKAATYEQSAWTFLCTSDWWDGTWQPSGNRYLDIRPDGLNERQHLAICEGGDVTAGEQSVFYNEVNAHKYGFIGIWFRMSEGFNGTQSKATLINATNASTCDGRILHWCDMDGSPGQKANGQIKNYYGGMWPDGRFNSFRHTIMHGFGGSNDEFKALIILTGRHGEIVDCAIEATSINILFGGGNPGEPQAIPEDWYLNRIYTFKDELRHKGSANLISRMPGYVLFSFGNVVLNKQCIEVKYGRRILIEAVIAENSYRGNDQIGSGITVQTQGNLDHINIQTQDVNVRHIKALDCVNPFGYFTSGSYNPELNPSPIARWDFCNIIAHKRSAAIRAPDERDEDIPDRGFLNATSAPQVYIDAKELLGPISSRWISWVSPITLNGEAADAEGWYRMRNGPNNSSQFGEFPLYAITHEDSLFPNRWLRRNGVNPGLANLNTSQTGGRTLRFVEAWPGAVNMARVVMPTDVPLAPRSSFNNALQEQHDNDNLWPGPMGDALYGYVKNDEVRGEDNDYTLSPSSPVKGVSLGGRDPGADVALLDTVLAGVKNWQPDEAQLSFPLIGGGTWPVMRIAFTPNPDL